MDLSADIVTTGNLWTLYLAYFRASESAPSDQMPLASLSAATNPYIDLTTWSSRRVYCHNGLGDFYFAAGAWTAGVDDLMVIRANVSGFSMWNKGGAVAEVDSAPPGPMSLGKLFNRFGLDCPFVGGVASWLFFNLRHDDTQVSAMRASGAAYFSL